MAVLKDTIAKLANAKAEQVQAWKDTQGMELADYGALTTAVNDLQRGELDNELSNLEATEGAEPPAEFKEKLLAAVKDTEEILNGVETIRSNSFKDINIIYCKPKATGGSSVNSFQGCAWLYIAEGIDASNSVDASRMFSGCRRLRVVEFTNDSLSKTTNFSETFYNCAQLRRIVIPAPWTALKSAIRAFSGCSSLEHIDIPDGSLANLNDGRYMFNCKSLKELTFPAGALAAVTDASSMFSGCSSLTSLTLPEGSFSKATTVSYLINGCKGIETFAFPEGSLVDTTGFSGVFQNCTSLKSVTFPAGSCSKGISMTLIFAGCTSLTTFTFPENGMASCLYAYNMIGSSGLTSLGNLDLSAIALTKAQLTSAGISTSVQVNSHFAAAAKITYGSQKNLTDCILHGTLYKSGARVDLLPNLDGPSVLSWVKALYDWNTNAEGKETDDTTHALYISAAQQELLLEQEGGDEAMANAMEYGWTLEG